MIYGCPLEAPYGYWRSPWIPYLPQTAEEKRAALRRLGEWWAWKQYHARVDRCCHGK